MTTPDTPGPRDASSLTHREREILAGIETDLSVDETLSRGLRELRFFRPPITRTRIGLLLALMTLLAMAGALVPAEWSVALGSVTVLLVVPWVLLCARDNSEHDSATA